MNNFKNKLQELLGISENQNLNVLCRTYLNIYENQNFKDIDKLISDFVAESTSIELEDNLKSKIIADFKVFALRDLGIRESYNTIMEDSEIVADLVYNERMKFVKNLFESNDDYIILEKVIETYKSFPEDLVIKEQVEKLEEAMVNYQDDIKVMNFLSLLESSKEYPATKNSCVKAIKNYLANPNGQTRIAVLESLRILGYKPEVKDFANYLNALNFTDDTYNHSTHVEGSLTTGRIMDNYMAKWHGAKTKAGISGIVHESLSEIQEMSKSIPNRFVGKLLTEKLQGLKLNSVEKEIYTQIQEDMQMIDMGVADTLNRISKTPIGLNPDFKMFKQRISEQQEANVPDYKLVDEVYNKISAFSYDSIVLDEMQKLSENFNKVEEKVNLERILEYIESNPRNGLYKNMQADLISYKEKPSKLLKNHILETHSKIAFEAPIRSFLDYFKQNTLTESNGIVNSNVNDFNISKVFSFYELTTEGENFRINGKNIIKRGDDITIVSDKKISPKVLELSSIFENLRMSVISENQITGFIDNRKFDIRVDENEDGSKYTKSLFIDGRKVDTVNEAHFLNLYTVAIGGNPNAIKALYKIYENIENSFVEVDFAHKITYKKNPNISAYFMNCNENFYLNLVNDSVKYNKFVKTSKINTLRNTLYEYMEFDISESFKDLMSKENYMLHELQERAKTSYNKIQSYEQKLKKLHESLNSITNQEIKTEMYSLCESIEEEIETLKDEYRDSVEKIDDMTEIKGEFTVGSRVKCKETDKIGIVTSTVNSENCTVEFEDGSMENYLCSDLELIMNKEKSEETEETEEGTEEGTFQYDANGTPPAQQYGESVDTSKYNKKKV